MAAHYSQLKPEWWSARIDLCLFFFFSLHPLLWFLSLPLLGTLHLHPGCRWSWQRLISFVFLCLSGLGPARRSSAFPIWWNKNTCIWGKPPTMYHCGIDCCSLPTRCILRSGLAAWERGMLAGGCAAAPVYRREGDWMGRKPAKVGRHTFAWPRDIARSPNSSEKDLQGRSEVE